ncbi:hypothetical protein ACFOGJ_16155 [Marinibaculum pumilum]|uniref:Uncharacterized protein n=1 Tax=Marinibaculum pumilum TaxID=1766165 RepID=A0ABV7L2Z1_9PROT
MVIKEIQMPAGGKRPGAGRPKGSRTKVGQELRDAAQKYTKDALQTLVAIAKKGESEAARVSAACAILDRAHGKPVQAHEHGGEDGKAIRIILTSEADG